MTDCQILAILSFYIFDWRQKKYLILISWRILLNLTYFSSDQLVILNPFISSSLKVPNWPSTFLIIGIPDPEMSSARDICKQKQRSRSTMLQL